MVPRRGLEPPRFYPLVPETSASTNSATRARGRMLRCDAHDVNGLRRHPCMPPISAWSATACGPSGPSLALIHPRRRILAPDAKNNQEKYRPQCRTRATTLRRRRLSQIAGQSRCPLRPAQRRRGQAGQVFPGESIPAPRSTVQTRRRKGCQRQDGWPQVKRGQTRRPQVIKKIGSAAWQARQGRALAAGYFRARRKRARTQASSAGRRRARPARRP